MDIQRKIDDGTVRKLNILPSHPGGICLSTVGGRTSGYAAIGRWVRVGTATVRAIGTRTGDVKFLQVDGDLGRRYTDKAVGTRKVDVHGRRFVGMERNFRAYGENQPVVKGVVGN